MFNPYQVLNVSESASDEDIRIAYLALVRENPPERDQQLFQQRQHAYELIKDQEARLRLCLFHVVQITPELISQSIQAQPQQPNRVDMMTFQAVLKSIITKVSPP